MTTRVNFAPTQTQVFQFQATLDGAQYNVSLPWLLFGNRYYVVITAPDQTVVVNRSLIGSAAGAQIASLSWQRGRALATTLLPHGYKLARIVTLTISDVVPDAYNGMVQALITGPRSFSYALAADPGPATVFGAASYDVSLTAGYFASTMVYRAPTRQFEISP